MNSEFASIFFYLEGSFSLDFFSSKECIVFSKIGKRLNFNPNFMKKSCKTSTFTENFQCFAYSIYVLHFYNELICNAYKTLFCILIKKSRGICWCLKRNTQKLFNLESVHYILVLNIKQDIGLHQLLRKVWNSAGFLLSKNNT